MLHAREAGYTLQALVPLELLAIEPEAGEMLLQFQASGVDADTGERHHCTAFSGPGVASATDNCLFGHFAVNRRSERRTGQLKAHQVTPCWIVAQQMPVETNRARPSRRTP